MISVINVFLYLWYKNYNTMINLEWLRTFRAVYKTKSLSKASEMLNISLGTRCFLGCPWINNLMQSLDIGDCTTCIWWKIQWYRACFTLTLGFIYLLYLWILDHKELTGCMVLYFFVEDTNLRISFLCYIQYFQNLT